MSSVTKSVVPRRSLVGVFNAFFSAERAGVVIDESLNLVALLRELERLREQVRKAELPR